jgi:hypothetical protein
MVGDVDALAAQQEIGRMWRSDRRPAPPGRDDRRAGVVGVFIRA